jgi:hypothetical protein
MYWRHVIYRMIMPYLTPFGILWAINQNTKTHYSTFRAGRNKKYYEPEQMTLTLEYEHEPKQMVLPF